MPAKRPRENTPSPTTPPLKLRRVEADGPDEYEVPNLSGSSAMEILHVAHLGDVLHRCGLLHTPVSAKALAGWLLAGKRAHRTDARFDLAVAGLDLLYELDPGYTHNHRLDGDMKKTHLLLSSFPAAVVVRLRHDAVSRRRPRFERLSPKFINGFQLQSGTE